MLRQLQIFLAILLLPLVLAEVSDSLAMAANGSCAFSLRGKIAQKVEFAENPGRVGFLCRDGGFFLRGTLTRLRSWQLPSKVFAAMAEKTGAEALESWEHGGLYRIAAAKPGEPALLCGYHVRDGFALDACAPEKETQAKPLVSSLLHEFRHGKTADFGLLRTPVLSTPQNVFRKENILQDVNLSTLRLPPGFVPLEHRENRALFTDAAGLTEIEIFYELSELPLNSAIAHKVYRKAVTDFVAKQGHWQIAEEPKDDNQTPCLVFSDKNTRLSHYCYAVAVLKNSSRPKYCRLTFVVAFLREAVDAHKLMAEQKELLQNWSRQLSEQNQ
ncbi:MAG: hypothetical protein N2Z22_00370 [Turneriella sp.]|nr:hypothetical protein [Leptospiraceae bacterium]MCX7631764.1 hypothetical protein [Turneriella sp.]